MAIGLFAPAQRIKPRVASWRKPVAITDAKAIVAPHSGNQRDASPRHILRIESGGRSIPFPRLFVSPSSLPRSPRDRRGCRRLVPRPIVQRQARRVRLASRHSAGACGRRPSRVKLGNSITASSPSFIAANPASKKSCTFGYWNPQKLARPP